MNLTKFSEAAQAGEPARLAGLERVCARVCAIAFCSGARYTREQLQHRAIWNPIIDSSGRNHAYDLTKSHVVIHMKGLRKRRPRRSLKDYSK
eukprot:3252516-Pleurochrysis_carterae.AAC.4